MTRRGWITAAILVFALLVILAALLHETASGPTFRAEDHASYDDCISNIPAEWRPGSLERSGAEDACHYVHRRIQQR